MNKSYIISFLILGFIIVCFFLYWFGIVTVDSEELIGYSFIIIGLALFYSGFQDNKGIQTFFGSAFFLTGLFLIIMTTFPITQRENLLIPTISFISGFSLLMVIIQHKEKILLIILTIICLVIGIYSLIFSSSISFDRFFSSVEKVGLSYWPIIIIFVLVTLLLSRDK